MSAALNSDSLNTLAEVVAEIDRVLAAHYVNAHGVVSISESGTDENEEIGSSHFGYLHFNGDTETTWSQKP